MPVDAYLRFRREGGAVDEHLADQMMLPLAIAGGAYTCGVPSLHTLTNASVIGAFTGFAPCIERAGDGPLHRIRVPRNRGNFTAIRPQPTVHSHPPTADGAQPSAHSHPPTAIRPQP